tara:strand:+ start:39 stop:254 length:216 start_codon:yes stop_codon:yes gene_type:complete
LDLSKLTDIQKISKKSFNDQKALIKKVLAGREMRCQLCNQVIGFLPMNDEQPARIQCAKRCTDIELDIVNT